MHSPKTQKAQIMRPNRKTLLPQFCQAQAESQFKQGQRRSAVPWREVLGWPVSQSATLLADKPYDH
jgi:hypothetical protein